MDGKNTPELICTTGDAVSCSVAPRNVRANIAAAPSFGFPVWLVGILCSDSSSPFCQAWCNGVHLVWCKGLSTLVLCLFPVCVLGRGVGLEKGERGGGKCLERIPHQEESGVLSFSRIYLTKLLSLQGLFPPGQGATIGVDFMIKTVEINGEKVKVGTS